MSYDDGRRSSGGITVDIKFKKIIFIKEFDSFPYRGKKNPWRNIWEYKQWKEMNKRVWDLKVCIESEKNQPEENLQMKLNNIYKDHRLKLYQHTTTNIRQNLRH